MFLTLVLFFGTLTGGKRREGGRGEAAVQWPSLLCVLVLEVNAM